jgi:hypothetical protein
MKKTFIIILSIFFIFNVNASENPFEENGAEIVIFNAEMPIPEIQAEVDRIYTVQNLNHFGKERYALLFEPGIYENLDISVGYNTQILGLGQSPDDVKIIGAVRTQDTPGSWDHGPGALNNFWRSVENLSVLPTMGSKTYPPGNQVVIPANQNVWAVSQAAPMRRVHIIDGDLRLFELGWTSGGYLANSKIDGIVEAGSQQQWFSRNSSWSDWRHGNWNFVFLGNEAEVPSYEPNPDIEGQWMNFPVTWEEKTPVIAEKPFLVHDNGEWGIQVPDLQFDTVGTDWESGVKKPLSEFYVAKEGDTASEINEQLSLGKSLLLTPGVYHLSTAIHITQANTVVLGIGLPTLHAIGEESVIVVDDVDGVRLAGFTMDAGLNGAEATLLQIGDVLSSADHSGNPIVISDIFARVGGEHEGTARSAVTINSNDVIGDNLWLWRADHDKEYPIVIPHFKNLSDTGVIVNGNNVTIYGLAVEHFQKYQTVWNGENGKTYFYQSELPYDVPKDWGHDYILGYASYKVGDNVQKHLAYGLGVYSFFANTPEPTFSDNAIEVPENSEMDFKHLITVYLNGDEKNPTVESGIRNVINNTGGEAITTYEKSRIPEYRSEGKAAVDRS